MDIDKYKKNIIVIACLITIIVIAIFVITHNNKTLEVSRTGELTTTQTTTLGTSETTITTIGTSATTTTTSTTTTTTPITTTTEATTTAWHYNTSIKKSTVEKTHNQTADCKGWIYIKGTAIDYPIMQSSDNEYYVTHAWNGAESHSGSIMLDYECTIGQTTNILLYGHNMGNGSMFHQIKSYKDSDWWEEHQYVEIASLDKIYVYQIFSVDVLYGLYDASFTYWLEPNKSLADETTYKNFVDTVVAKRYTSAGISAPSYPTGILTLQTCNSGADDGMRCVAFGKLVDVQDLT